MRYRLRTLMILLAVLPPMMAYGYVRLDRYRERQAIMQILRDGQRRHSEMMDRWRAGVNP